LEGLCKGKSRGEGGLRFRLNIKESVWETGYDTTRFQEAITRIEKKEDEMQFELLAT
jgi:hypothetical protein